MVGGASRPQTESPNSIRRSRPQAISPCSSNRNARAQKRPAPSPARVRRACGQTWSSIVFNSTAPSLSRRRPRSSTSTKKSFRLHESSVVRRGDDGRTSGCR